jgi:hypothetical protein
MADHRVHNSRSPAKSHFPRPPPLTAPFPRPVRPYPETDLPKDFPPKRARPLNAAQPVVQTEAEQAHQYRSSNAWRQYQSTKQQQPTTRMHSNTGCVHTTTTETVISLLTQSVSVRDRPHSSGPVDEWTTLMNPWERPNPNYSPFQAPLATTSGGTKLANQFVL